MLDIEKLKQDREKAFDIWFEKWRKKEGLEKKIEKANQEGFTGLVVAFNNYNEDEQRWMRKPAFLSKLQDMLPGFGVDFKYVKRILTNSDYLYGIDIDWQVYKSEDLED